MNLELVRWPAAIQALEQRAAAEPSPQWRRLLAEACSLSALFESGFAEAIRRVEAAVQLEPLNPQHAVRRALVYLRFGDTEAAVDALPGEVRDNPYVLYVRALIALRAGDAMRARTLATDLLESVPGHVPALFLQAEAQLHIATKGFRARAEAAPRGAEHGNRWADLLVKVALSLAGEGPKLCRSLVGSIPPGGPAAELVQRALSWMSADADALVASLASIPPGSRAEQIALLCLNDTLLTVGDPASRLRRLHSVWSNHPDRTAIRRMYVAALTQQAMAEAGAERYSAALRLVEACLRLEPHESIHHQNRAALFTALLDDQAYQTGWADLDRHHYRLALLGRFDPAAVRKTLRSHRMFAQQAKTSHLFASETGPGSSTAMQIVNQSGIDADPEQLRQWIHHRRAELVFLHCALGARPERILLYPESTSAARQRAAGMTLAVQSLAALVPEEGAQLASLLRVRWEQAAVTAPTRYGEWPDDEEARALAVAHLETLGDLAMLARQLRPGPVNRGAVDELLEFIDSEAPFFDDRVLFREVANPEGRQSPSLRYLADLTRTVLRLSDAPAPISERKRAKLLGSVSATLLVHVALVTFESGARRDASVDASLEVLERARKLDTESPWLELSASRLLTIGEYFDEARTALASYHRLARGGRGEFPEDAAEIGSILDAKRKESVRGRRRSPNTDAPAQPAGDVAAGSGAEALELELERFPDSIQLHEDLVRLLIVQGAFQLAAHWSEHAVAHCLSRDGQSRARCLHMETLGLRELASVAGGAAALYASGSTAGLLEALERLEDLGTLAYPVHFLHGVALLAAKRTDEAQRAFIHALAHCNVQMHRAVLRPLAFDIEEALLRRLEREVDDALRDGRIEQAMNDLELAWPRLTHPETCLAEVARIELARVVTSANLVDVDARRLVLPCSAPWAAELSAALAHDEPLARVRALADLAIALYEPSSKKAQSVRRRAEVVGAKIALARAIQNSSSLLRAGQTADALAVVDAVTGAGEPAWLRQRIVTLLALERFDDADAEKGRLVEFRDAQSIEFCARYAKSACARRLTVAVRLLRSGNVENADAVLAPAQADGPVQELELAYSRAFSLALRAAQARKVGAKKDDAQALRKALSILEVQLELAGRQGHARVLQLYERLDSEFSRVEEAYA